MYFPHGVPLYNKYEIAGAFLVTGNVTMPYGSITCSGPPYIYLSPKIKEYVIPNFKQTKPIVIPISDSHHTVYWLRSTSTNTSDCFQGSTMTQRETKSYCKNSTNKFDLPYETIDYNITEVLGVILKAGYYSCFHAITIYQPSYKSQCKLILELRQEEWGNHSFNHNIDKYPNFEFWYKTPNTTTRFMYISKTFATKSYR